jgi:hypothetical protein
MPILTCLVGNCQSTTFSYLLLISSSNLYLISDTTPEFRKAFVKLCALLQGFSNCPPSIALMGDRNFPDIAVVTCNGTEARQQAYPDSAFQPLLMS